jgi:penicillin-binding protein 1A
MDSDKHTKSTQNSEQTSPPRQRKRKKKRKVWPVLKYLFLFLIISGLIVAGAAYKYIKDVVAETPKITEYDILQLLDENSFIYDNAGNMLEKVQLDGVRTIVRFQDIDEDIKNAFIAVEDKTFYTHNGFNYVRLIGAVVDTVTKGKRLGGTSTITQQYARNMYLPEEASDRSIDRKIREAYYTLDIEDKLDKEQILTAYLNTIPLGGNTKGIQAACQRYFSKDAKDIDYIEAAILAGIPKATTTYSPFKNKPNDELTSEDIILGEDLEGHSIIFNSSALDRYYLVVRLMHDNGYISDDEYDIAKTYDIVKKFKPGKFANQDISSYFVDIVKEDALEALMKEKNITKDQAQNLLYGGGLKIYSTLDLNIQKVLERAYNVNEFSNTFDSALKSAINQFQKKYDLGSDGVVGPNTLTKLAELGYLSIEEMTQKKYSAGMQHEEVIRLKEAMEKDGLLFKTNDSMPSIDAYRDVRKNILQIEQDEDKSFKGAQIVLNRYDALINEQDQLVIYPDGYIFDAQGNLILNANKQFNFYRSYKTDEATQQRVELGIDIIIKDAYKTDDSLVKILKKGSKLYADQVNIKEMYIYKGKSIQIPYEFKSLDDKRNLVISREFIASNPNVFVKDEAGNLLVSPEHYGMSKTGIIQPQSAMVVIDYHTGELKAMMGGRNVTGQKIFNRADNPRPPGSSIKPIGAYLPAIDNGLTAATVFDDSPRFNADGLRWPLNWYEHQDFKYWGLMTIREAIEWSNNVIAVKTVEQIGIEKCISYLKKLGITTIVEEGPTNDVNLAAIGLGGMSKGLKPLELTAAYGALANKGILTETISFTKITDKDGNTIIDNTPYNNKVVDEKVAFLIQDMMQSGATIGLSNSAAIRKGNTGIPISGKTGTTSNKLDAWFVGFTPYYAAGVWIGNDVQIPLSDGSKVAALFWKKVMTELHKDLADKNFEVPEGLIRLAVDSKSGKLPSDLSSSDPRGSTVISEYFIPGTQPTEVDDVHVSAIVCNDSGKIANPEFCPAGSQAARVFIKRPAPYIPALSAGSGSFRVKDDMYDLPVAYEYTDSAGVLIQVSDMCQLHTAETVVPVTPGSGLGPNSTILNKFISIQLSQIFEQTYMLMQDAYIETNDGVVHLGVAGTIIDPIGNITLPDGTIIYGVSIVTVQPVPAP